VESRYSEDLKGYLSNRGLDELPGADFFGGLSSMTALELCKVPSLTNLVLAAGTVTDVGPSTVQVDGRSPLNEATRVDLPAELFPTGGVPGEPVWVLSRLVGSAALVEVLPARTTTFTVTRTDREQWLRWGGEWLESMPLTGDVTGMSDEAVAGLYESTGAARLSGDHIRRLHEAADAGMIPVRQLRPVG
jgi:hypothetical protein